MKTKGVNKILYKELSYQVVGAAMEVHNILGPGFLEKVYENALLSELELRGINAISQHPLQVNYKGNLVGNYITDIVVENKIILELKAIKSISDIHIAQVINYLTATGYKLAILLNFGADKLESKRIVK